jgi:hypothetical protein
VTDSPVELRVGDRERAAVDAQLQAAVGDGVLTLAEYDERAARLWEARTVADLARLVHDLPSSRSTGVSPAPAPVVAAPARRSYAVMSGDEVSGPFAAGEPVEAYAVMGGACIDLRREDLPADMHLKVVAFMGGVEVLVPRGATVHLSGLAFMGGRDCTVDPPVPGAPVIRLEAWAFMGGVVVGHGKGAASQVSAPHRPHPPLVPAQHGWSPPATVPPRAPARRPGRVRRAVGRVALLGALVVGGGAVLAAGEDGAAVFGSQTVSVGDGDSAVSVLFGSVTVVVPDDARVSTSGTVVFGSVECRQACDPQQSGEVVDLRSWGAFGSVEVMTRAEAVARGDLDDD